MLKVVSHWSSHTLLLPAASGPYVAVGGQVHVEEDRRGRILLVSRAAHDVYVPKKVMRLAIST